MDRVTDPGEAMTADDRKRLRVALERFEAQFPQLFFAVYVGPLGASTNIRLFGFWLLNRAALSSVDFTRPNENGVALVVDTRSRSCALVLGYLLERHCEERETTAILHHQRAAFAAGQIGKAALGIVGDFARLVRKKAMTASRRAKSSPTPSEHPASRPLRPLSPLAQSNSDPQFGRQV